MKSFEEWINEPTHTPLTEEEKEQPTNEWCYEFGGVRVIKTILMECVKGELVQTIIEEYFNPDTNELIITRRIK